MTISPIGFAGSNSGYAGSRGQLGYAGSRGGTGYAGSRGAAGTTGTTGTTGFAGSRGAAGTTGTTGFAGSRGAGFAGSRGTGFAGSNGTAGYSGSRGIIGLTGSTGSPGNIGLTGSTGSPGNIGLTGSTGATGAGYTGSLGYTGFTGSTGSPGNIGATGVTGYTGSISTGYTGSAGSGGSGGSGVSIIPNKITYSSTSLVGHSNPGFTVVNYTRTAEQVSQNEWPPDAYSIPVDFPIQFLGNSYSAGNVFLTTTSYLAFGPDAYAAYQGPYVNNDTTGPVVIPVPAIHVGSQEQGYALGKLLNKYYYGYANGTDVFVIGFSGFAGATNYTGGGGDWRWELHVSAATPDQLKIVVADYPAAYPGGIWGISNGAVWIDRFRPLPWRGDSFTWAGGQVYNTIIIAPVAPVAVSTIAITGPGVTYSENGGTTYINVDPFDNRISVGATTNFITGSITSVISSVTDGLTLTTGKRREPLHITPSGDVNIDAGSRTADELDVGNGSNIYIYGGNGNGGDGAIATWGGDVYISGGHGYIPQSPPHPQLGRKNITEDSPRAGVVSVQSNNNVWIFGTDGNITLPPGGDIVIGNMGPSVLGVSVATLKQIVADSTDFANFQSRIASM